MSGPLDAPTPEIAQARLTPASRVVIVGLAVVGATVAAVLLEQVVGVIDASAVYLVAVVVAAALLGTTAAVTTSVVSFLLYDYLFTSPRFRLEVSDPGEWLSLLLFLLVAVVIGRLTVLLRDRAETAERRSRESIALVAISREIAMATSFEEAAANVTSRLRVDAEMEAVWVTLQADPELTVAAAGPVPDGESGTPWRLMRSSWDGSSDWLRIHEADAPVDPSTPADLGVGERYDVAIEGEDAPAGWLRALRLPGDPRPGRGARRLLAMAADQLGIALRRDELRAELTEAEVVRQGDAFRGAILDSVSHDLRTPVASIRALAGGLADAAVVPDAEAVRRTAAAIDLEGSRLGDLVNGLLDMGRIQAGAIRPDLQAYDLAELVETTVRHRHAAGIDRRVTIDIPEDLAPVVADAVLLDVALGNVLDNADRHAPPPAEVRVRAAPASGGRVLVAVDDSGPGVPANELPRIFDRFYRVPTTQEPARHGIGMGLAIARGFVEAMGGTIEAEASDLGGLGIRIVLPAAEREDKDAA